MNILVHGPELKDFYDEERQEWFKSWVMWWTCVHEGRKYGDYMMMSDEPKGLAKEKISQLLMISARKSIDRVPS